MILIPTLTSTPMTTITTATTRARLEDGVEDGEGLDYVLIVQAGCHELIKRDNSVVIEVEFLQEIRLRLN